MYITFCNLFASLIYPDVLASYDNGLGNKVCVRSFYIISIRKNNIFVVVISSDL